MAILGGLASSVFAQWYQTWQQEKAWRRDQHERALQNALDKALEANVLMEQLFFASRELERTFDTDQRSRSAVRSALEYGRKLIYAGVVPSVEFEKVQLTDRLSDALHAQRVRRAQFLMLLYQSVLPEFGVPESKAVRPDVLEVYAEWSAAADHAGGAYIRYVEALDKGRASQERLARDDAVAKESAAQKKLRAAVTATCQRAAARLHMFRKYGPSKAEGAPLDPPLPWIE